VSILTSWFVKLVVAMALFALVAFDAVEVLIAHVGGQNDAANAAYAAAQTWQTTHSYPASIIAARQAIPVKDRLGNAGCTSIDGQTWTCTLTRPARTLLMSDLGFLKRYTVARETGSGSYQP
jgi:hypothetical protein